MKVLVFFVSLLWCCAVHAKIDPFAYRELHVLFQKADRNLDRFLDKTELNHFVKSFIKRIPGTFKHVRVSNDDVEGGKVLAEELFNRFDTDGDGKLDYRGTLLSKAEATVFAEMLEKVLINLIYEINDKKQPFPDVNPFENDAARVKRDNIEQSKYGTATIKEIPASEIKIKISSQNKLNNKL